MLATFCRSRIWRCVAFIVLFVSIVSVTAAEDRTAYVLDVRGQWRLEHTSTDLVRAATVKESSHLQHFSGSQQDYIVLAGLWNAPKRFSCAPPDGCTQTYTIVSTDNEGQSRVAHLYSVVMEMWRGQQSWDEGFSRGTELREAVLGLSNGKLSLAPTFSGLPRDVYHLRIRRIEDENGMTRFTEIDDSVIFNWDPDHAMPLAINGIRPGLYEVALMATNPGGQYEYNGVSSWTLVCEANLSACEGSFREASALTNGWGDAVRPAVRRNFLRTYLQSLSPEAK
jgi:hypothetical protein